MKKLFITATDTDAGKTFMAQAIMKELADRRHQVVGFKPVSAGCEQTELGLRNEDALALQQQSTLELDYQEVNPIAFADPVAPHLAAQKQHCAIELSTLTQAYDNLLAKNADYVITEGAGGWRLPLTDSLFLSDLAIQYQMEVVVVVPVRLGCLNHARLTVEAVRHDGLAISGWIANVLDGDLPYLKENIASLQQLIDAPLLGAVPRVEDAASAARYLDVTPLF